MSTSIDLKGRWGFALDTGNAGIRERWFARELEETIALPGTTDEAQKGEFADERCVDRLSRIWRWIGPAWYQRTVTIPKRWAGKRIVLFLERTKDSQVWVDRTWMGGDDSLSTPHTFDLSRKLTPGRHRLTILVDNAKLPPVGPCHQVDERTQTNWNGIVGRIELRATDRVWIDDIQVHPEQTAQMKPDESEEVRQRMRVAVRIGNATRRAVEANLVVRAEVVGRSDAPRIPAQRFKARLKAASTPLALEVPIPNDTPRWDEFDRALLRVTVSLTAPAAGMKDRRSARCGLRTFGTARGQFVVNGRPTFLRGKNDCALFPLTGYAPMDKDYWLRHLGIAADYGINHFRFHSWCPPEAAFAAADELGIYFQVELPNKRGITHPENRDYTPPKEAYETLDELAGDGGPPAARTTYLTREGERMLRTYGNHPSFAMMTLGNEIGGDVEVMKGMCDRFRALDGRHLYAMGTNHFHWAIRYREGDEFWVIKGTAKGRHVRGASWEAECHVDHAPPSTTVDYAARLLGVPVPVVGHEMAQYEVFPDFGEIERYTGVLKARCFEIFRERLAAAGMLDQAADFLKASGAISAICHREDVEAALRTPGFGGFQMLDLQDFSGQGVALVGLLNVFMESKGLIEPAEWREFCCETVPLLWMTKYTWTNDETFRARIRVAHYGPRDLERASVAWRISECRMPNAECSGGGLVSDSAGAVSAGPKATLAKECARNTERHRSVPERVEDPAFGIRHPAFGIQSGVSRSLTIPTGTVTDVDLFCADLQPVRRARKLEVALSLPGTPYRNRYPIWVYPAKVETEAPEGIRVARAFDRRVEAELRAGGRVLLLARPERLKRSVAMAFQSGFWSPMFRKPGRLNPLGRETPGTQGILCDPAHPLFRDFPTELHTNWQWWPLVKNSRAMILDAMPAGFRPLVQVIDGFDRNHRLGLVFEARVGQGRLLVCSIDLPALQAHPEARQFLAGLQRYAASGAFAPAQAVEAAVVRAIV